MIRLSLLRLTLRVAKAATALSDSLRPATWKLIAIASALIGVSFLFMYDSLKLAKPGLEIPPIQVAAVEPVPLSHDLSAINETSVTISESETIDNGFSPGYPEISAWSLSYIPDVKLSRLRLNARGHLSVDVNGLETGSCAITARAATQSELLVTAYSGGDITLDTPRASLHNLGLPYIGAPEPRVVVSQPLSSTAWTVLDLFVKLVLLFQGVTGIFNSFLAMVLSLIAYNRSKVDLKLKALDLQIKQLQILQLQRQLEREAREWQKKIEAETKSNIILAN